MAPVNREIIDLTACYIRVSHQEQKLHGLSLDAQREILIRYAEENNLKIVDWYEDEGISGRKLIRRRPALQRMLNDAKTGKFKRIIFIKLDRYFRSVAEYYECQKILEANNVVWTATEEKFDLTTANGRYWVTQKLAMAEYEADQTGERISLVNEYKVRTGQPLTGAQSLGLAFTVGYDEKTGLKNVIPDPETKDLIHDFIEYFLTHHSLKSSTVYVNNKYGTTYEYHQFKNVLKDTKLCGHYRGNDFYCEGYVDKATWDKIQELSKSNIKKRKNNRVYLFSSLITCPSCGRKLSGICSINRKKVKPNGKVYLSDKEIFQYRCNKAKMSELCSFRKYPNEAKLEKVLLDNLNKFINNHITHVKITANTNTHTEGIKNSINNIQSEMNRLNTMFKKGRIKEDEYDRDFEDLERQLAELQEGLTPVEERDLTVYEELLAKDNWKDLYNALNRENKRAFWRKYIKGIKLDLDGNIDEIIFF
jgi:DNA invertase Pin-like site-specific DNA recombinase